jgi:hypothetical protein
VRVSSWAARPVASGSRSAARRWPQPCSHASSQQQQQPASQQQQQSSSRLLSIVVHPQSAVRSSTLLRRLYSTGRSTRMIVRLYSVQQLYRRLRLHCTVRRAVRRNTTPASRAMDTETANLLFQLLPVRTAACTWPYVQPKSRLCC